MPGHRRIGFASNGNKPGDNHRACVLYVLAPKAPLFSAVCSLFCVAAGYAVTASGANVVSIFADALKKSWIDWLNR